MNINQELMNEFNNQLKKGRIQKAYKLLLDYIMKLKLYLENKYSNFDIPGSIYHGYLDMTYFPIFPKSLKHYNLKIALVFNYNLFRFEIWLSAKNKSIQKKYWEKFKKLEIKNYELTKDLKGEDAIIKYIFNENLNYNDLDSCTNKIELEILNFIKYIESIISKY